ncbi:hypothetical protein AB0G85_36785, partial [Streptomyces sioyaensis]|uniref:hypothetical protein n=1 Tax=Streptomyces sioyaensis TaxID=67364 RepID=UPI0033EA41FF
MSFSRRTRWAVAVLRGLDPPFRVSEARTALDAPDASSSPCWNTSPATASRRRSPPTGAGPAGSVLVPYPGGVEGDGGLPQRFGDRV